MSLILLFVPGLSLDFCFSFCHIFFFSLSQFFSISDNSEIASSLQLFGSIATMTMCFCLLLDNRSHYAFFHLGSSTSFFCVVSSERNYSSGTGCFPKYSSGKLRIFDFYLGCHIQPKSEFRWVHLNSNFSFKITAYYPVRSLNTLVQSLRHSINLLLHCDSKVVRRRPAQVLGYIANHVEVLNISHFWI